MSTEARAPNRPLVAGDAQRLNVDARGLSRAARRIGAVLVFAVLPALLLAFALTPRYVYGPGWDFRTFFDAAHQYVSGASPYPAATLQAVAGKDVFVYPAPAAAAIAPLSFLPFWVAFGIWVAASVAAVLGALWILGVRDWRCYGAVFLTFPVVDGVRLGTFTPALLLLLALLWRYRDRWRIAAAAIAAMVVLKLFLWPLAVWLLLSRRLKAVGGGAVAAAVVTIAAWIPLGFASARAYPHVLSVLSRYEEASSFSPSSLGYLAGLGRSLTHALVVAAGVALLVAAAKARRDDFLAFRLCLASAFVFTPIVWTHYWMLLLVPLALTQPRLSPRWFAAAWIPPGGPAMTWTAGTAAWVGAALATIPIQLGFVPRVPSIGGRRVRLLAAALGVAALFVASEAARDHGALRGATLHATAGSGFAEARFRISTGARRICWLVVTADARASRPIAALARGGGGRIPLRSFDVRRDGTSRGCTTYAPTRSAILRGVVRRPGDYRFEIETRTGLLAGPLRT